MSRILDAGDLLRLVTDGAMTSLDQLFQKRTGGSNGNPQYKDWHKEWRVGGGAASASVAAQWHSLFTFEGRPAAGATPTTWANPTSSTQGAFGQADASGGRALWSSIAEAVCGVGGGLLCVYDRLGHCGGLSGTTITAQNTNGGSAGGITRYTGGARNELWLEIYTAIGATATTATCSYADQGAGASTSAPVVFGGAGRQEQGRIIKCSMAGKSGDYGVQSVTSVTVLATTGTAGNFGVTIARPLVYIPIAVINASVLMSLFEATLPKIQASACLAFAILPSIAGSPLVNGSHEFAEA